MEAVVEGRKLFTDGFIQQEVDVELYVFCGNRRKNTFNNIFHYEPLPARPPASARSLRAQSGTWNTALLWGEIKKKNTEAFQPRCVAVFGEVKGLIDSNRYVDEGRRRWSGPES